MFLFALFPAALACALFFGSLRQRVTTQAQREHVAATARETRALIGRSLLVFALVSLPFAAVAGARMAVEQAAFIPGELK